LAASKKFSVANKIRINLNIRITGKDRYKFIERLTVADIINLPVGTATLSVITNENGGIIDDTIITNKGDHIYVVINAGCFDKDYAHIMAQLDQFKKQGHQVDIQLLSNEYSLLALQGTLLFIIAQIQIEWDPPRIQLFSNYKRIIVSILMNVRSFCRGGSLQIDQWWRGLVEVHDW